MSKYLNNPILHDHLDLPEMAEAFDKCEMTIRRWCEDSKNPLPHIRMPNGSLIFNIAQVQKWIAQRERSAMPTPRRRKATIAA